jgi:hypothetical protein
MSSAPMMSAVGPYRDILQRRAVVVAFGVEADINMAGMTREVRAGRGFRQRSEAVRPFWIEIMAC